MQGFRKKITPVSVTRNKNKLYIYIINIVQLEYKYINVFIKYDQRYEIVIFSACFNKNKVYLF